MGIKKFGAPRYHCPIINVMRFLGILLDCDSTIRMNCENAFFSLGYHEPNDSGF